MTRLKAFRSALCAALASFAVSSVAQPVQYTFSTASNRFGNLTIANMLGSNAYVSGSFMYDPSAPATGSLVSGGYGSATVYDPPGNSVFNLSGSVGGYSFSDPQGRTIVGNNMPDFPDRPPGLDWLGLNFDPGVFYGAYTFDSSRPRELSGFIVGDYTLMNIRMIWQSGIAGATDFLTSNSMPNVLPGIPGRLALDFVLTADPTNLARVPFYSNTVSFDSLTVQAAPIPEPETYAMLLAGLGLLGWHARRRKLKLAA